MIVIIIVIGLIFYCRKKRKEDLNQRSQIHNSPNYPISPTPRIINCQIIQPSQPRHRLL